MTRILRIALLVVLPMLAITEVGLADRRADAFEELDRATGQSSRATGNLEQPASEAMGQPTTRLDADEAERAPAPDAADSPRLAGSGDRPQCRRPGDICGYVGGLPAKCAPNGFCVPPDFRDLPRGLRCTSLLGALGVSATAIAARDRITTAIGTGFKTTILGVGGTAEFGIVGGPEGQAACYVSACTGLSVELGAHATYEAFGVYRRWEDFPGQSRAVSGGVSSPIVEIGAGWATVLNTDNEFIGHVTTVGTGIGVLPAGLDVMSCFTVTHDGNTLIGGNTDALIQYAKQEAVRSKARLQARSAVEASVLPRKPLTDIGIEDARDLRVVVLEHGRLFKTDEQTWAISDFTLVGDDPLWRQVHADRNVVRLVMGEWDWGLEINWPAKSVSRWNRRDGRTDEPSAIKRAYKFARSVQDPRDAHGWDASLEVDGRFNSLSFEPNFEYTGGDHQTVTLEVHDPSACLLQCARSPGCTSYTYVAPAVFDGTAPECRLRSAVATRENRAPLAGAVTGRKLVTAYADCGFKGAFMTLEDPRLYNHVDLWGPREDYSSLRIPKGHFVTLYERDKGNGRALTFEGKDVPCLAANDFDDATRSILVSLQPPPKAPPTPPPPAFVLGALKPGATTWNVVAVDTTDGGRYEKVDSEFWKEGGVHSFREKGRDFGAVYLYDRNRNLSVTLNIREGTVRLGDKLERGTLLARIRQSLRRDYGTPMGDGVTLENLVQVQTEGPRFYRIDKQTWVEEGVGLYIEQAPNGRTLPMRYWAGNHVVEIDLQRKVVVKTATLQRTSNTYRISQAYRYQTDAKGAAPAAPEPDPGGGGLKYGDTVTIKATASRWPGHDGYLSPCGMLGACGVGVTLRPDAEYTRHGRGSNLRNWLLLGGPGGQLIRYGDTLRIKATASRWAGHDGFLAPCGQTEECGIDVTLRPDAETDKHGPNSRLRDWQILGGAKGEIVRDGDKVQLKAMASGWAGHDGYLSPCGETGAMCGTGVTLRPEQAFQRHEPNSNLRTWEIRK